jgi:hypothetical protein
MVIVIIRLMGSVIVWPKVIPLSGVHRAILPVFIIFLITLNA